MILQALTNHYETLAKKGLISPEGWAKVGVTFAIKLDKDGNLTDLMVLKHKEERGKKEVDVPTKYVVPAQAKRSSAIKANFLCGNPKYLFGIEEDIDEKKQMRAKECFEASAVLHKELLGGLECVEAKAVCKFFDNWNVEEARENPIIKKNWKELCKDGNLIFRVNGIFVQETQDVKNVWNARSKESEDDTLGCCAVTGEKDKIARLHALIKGVRGAKSGGASLICFNTAAAESYAKTQSYNSSVGECATFAYTTALNYLLADSEHVKIIGDTTVVYWAKTAETEVQDFFGMGFFGDEVSEFGEEDLKGAMKALAKGRRYDMNGFILNPETEFYILGLSPNTARLSVRFFYRNTFGSLMKNLEEHYERMEIVRPSFDHAEPLSIWKLLNETVNPNSKDKSASPVLAGVLAMAILNNQRYPAVLMNGIMLRIRAEQNINRARAGIIKAFLLKNSSNKYIREALTMELNEQCDYMPYVLGRLFSVLEEIQEAANPGLNVTIKDRFFNSASSRPAIIFPQILNLKNNHIKVIIRENFGYAVNLEKKVQGLLSLIHEPFPKHLNIEDQGTFNIGYYHQTQKRFEKKIKENNKNENTIENNKED